MTTDERGGFEIPGGVYETADHDYSLFVLKDGYQRYQQTVIVHGDTRLEIPLVRTRSLP